jgi:hypothetical protein
MSSVEADRSGELRPSDDYRGWPVLSGTGQRVGQVDALFEDAEGRPRFLGLRSGPHGLGTPRRMAHHQRRRSAK